MPGVDYRPCSQGGRQDFGAISLITQPSDSPKHKKPPHSVELPIITASQLPDPATWGREGGDPSPSLQQEVCPWGGGGEYPPS